jgi:hypothetical protein
MDSNVLLFVRRPCVTDDPDKAAPGIVLGVLIGSLIWSILLGLVA